MGHAIMPFAEIALWMHSVELITIKKIFRLLTIGCNVVII